MITLRTDKKLENAIERTARQKGLTKSEFVRRSLVEYISAHEQASPYKIGEDLFGRYGSGKGGLAEDSEKIIRNKMKKKKSNAS